MQYKIYNIDRLSKTPTRRLVLESLEAALRRADPTTSVKKHLRRVGRCVETSTSRKYCPKEEVYILGFGKASEAMASGAIESLGDLVGGGVVISPSPLVRKIDSIEVLPGDHPVPGENTLSSTKKLLETAQSLPEESLALVLISGGGSALLEYPAEGITLEEIAEITTQLMKRGADIYELNTVRKHLSSVKGGQLLRYIASKNVVSLVISDVIGDRLDTIASGPTVPDETTYIDAKHVLSKYNLWSKLPEHIIRHIEDGVRGKKPETPKPGDPIFQGKEVIIVASNIDSLRATKEYLEANNIATYILTDRLRGEAREAAKIIASVIESVHTNTSNICKPACAIIAGGETTVTVKGSGKGGRNQELCLALSIELYNTRLPLRYTAACMGTDGVDGSSPVAGAVIDTETIPRAYRLGLDPEEYLVNNDSYTFFRQLGDTIDTGGYTGTNVNDIFIAIIEE